MVMANFGTPEVDLKLFICGYARHGKDAAAEYLSEAFGLRHESSSHIAMRTFLREQLIHHGLTYETEEDCYADRVNHRKLWFDMICEYNRDDPARLSRLIFKDNDIYVGIRNIAELEASRREGLADLVIWIDASERLGTVESKFSNNIGPEDCDLIVTNNGTLEEFHAKLHRIFYIFAPVA